MAWHGMAGYGMAGQQDRTGQDTTGQDRTRQDRAGQGRAGQDTTRLVHWSFPNKVPNGWFYTGQAWRVLSPLLLVPGPSNIQPERHCDAGRLYIYIYIYIYIHMYGAENNRPPSLTNRCSIGIRPISLLTLSLLRSLDSNIPGDSP